MHRQITGCRICGSEWLDVLLELGTQFLTGVFPRSADESLTKGPLTLVRCDECGLVQLLYSYERTELYGAHYGYRSSLNRKMVSHLEDKARMLLGAVDLRPDDVILDIGSNDGTLLSFFSGKDLCLLGVDPSAARWRGRYPGDSRLIEDFFSADLVRREEILDQTAVAGIAAAPARGRRIDAEEAEVLAREEREQRAVVAPDVQDHVVRPEVDGPQEHPGFVLEVADHLPVQRRAIAVVRAVELRSLVGVEELDQPTLVAPHERQGALRE